MIAKYHIEGIIEVELNDYDIAELNEHKSVTMKKAYLEDLLKQKLETCSRTADIECGVKVDFDDVYVKVNRDVCEKEIETENLPLTAKEVIDDTINEIAERKKRK